MDVTRNIFWTHSSSNGIKRSSSIRWVLMMNMKIIIIIITLMMITTSVNAFLPMGVNLNKALPESRITQRFFGVKTACSCRTRCNVVPRCFAAMIYTHSSGVLDCYLSEGKSFSKNELLPNASAITLLKPITECPTSFVMVSGGSCIKVVSQDFNSSQSRKACQDMGADIFSPDADYQILPVYNYLNATWPSYWPDWKFWVGIKDRKWLDGRNVTNWYDGQPDGTLLTERCGFLTHLGKLAEKNCAQSFWSVCEIKVFLQ